MAYEVNGFIDGTRPAAADLSAKQFFAVSLNTSAQYALSGAEVRDVGLLQNKPKSGEAAEVVLDGIAKGVAGAAVTIGDFLMTNSSGKLITATAGKHIVGQAMTAAGADGDIITVRVGYLGTV